MEFPVRQDDHIPERDVIPPHGDEDDDIVEAFAEDIDDDFDDDRGDDDIQHAEEATASAAKKPKK